MAEFRRLFYGWHDAAHDCLRLSQDPPDAPVRRSVAFAGLNDARDYAARKRARIMWLPKLPDAIVNKAA